MEHHDDLRHPGRPEPPVERDRFGRVPGRAGGRRRGGGAPRRNPRRAGLRTAAVAAAAGTAAALAVATGVDPAPSSAGPVPAASPGAVRTGAVPAAARPVPVLAEPGVEAQLGERWPLGGRGAARRTDRFVTEVVALTNTARAKAGCKPLRAEKRLRAAAQGHAADMAARGYYEHLSPEGRNAGDRMRSAGYAWSTWAENIHRGPKTAARAVADWMGSPGHRANVLNCAFKDIGVGVVMTSNGPWWVQDFGVRR